ncbi:leukocyte-associated immunoglobulin-like receptor 1 isoform X1 [Cavia porcellus]|uniref:Ig-like domain-containing protein n=1 Tax=Cavia porcellus TaxID=10141 RepID=H0UTF3_CAVPO|nr:leukocyte-associated immunoglobulin-like receptor 1 isoform X1 [Cavia porcellus]
MAPRPTCLLALVLCLVHGILTRQGSLSQPSISAEPGSVISRGRNVTILCQANGGFELFRLEKCSPGNGPTFKDEKNTSSFQKEARFAFTLMNPGCYVCIYQKSSTWSPRSEKLNLTVADADVTQASIPTASAVASDSTSPGATEVLVDRGPFASPGHLYVLVGVCMGFLALLLLLLLCCLHHQHQNKYRPPSCKDQEQRPQERASLAGDIPGRTAVQATADRPPQQGASTLLQGPQEVTYAQLDHRTLTQRGNREVSPQAMAEPCMYAVITR